MFRFAFGLGVAPADLPLILGLIPHVCRYRRPDRYAPDYRDTVFLPETAFPMRAGLPQREPEWLARWERIGVYDRLRSYRCGAGAVRAA